MSTTQRSESMHAFFDGYVNSKTTLKQFVEQYENALHNKVEKEKLADFACFNSRVPCKNRYEFEKQFQDAFTIDKFKKFMDEFAGKIYCGLSSVKENIALVEFLVYEDVKVWESSKRVIFKVILNEEANEVKCNCRLFEFRGILCRHIILVLIEKQIFRISEKYIFRRWRKDIKRCHTKVKVSYADWSSKPEAHRFEKMCNLFYEVADMATKSDEKCNMVMGFVNDLKLKLTSNEVVRESNQHETNVIDGATQVDKLEDTSNEGCKILSPRVVRGKGRPPSKRLQSKVEKVIQKRKARNIQMKSNEKKLEKDLGEQKVWAMLLKQKTTLFIRY
ncbi:protein FAR-RED IMPAIRED RESPONSE 1-like [Prunus dulcis]|nr:protein FAR-RED IMPAIRED RESPONSE 1-like [Prunus dulcis]